MLTTNFSNTARSLDAGPAGTLSEDELRRVVPSVFAETAHDSRSDRYTYLPTIDVVRGLCSEGFAPVFACEAKSRDATKLGYTKHMLRFRRDYGDRFDNDVPEVILINSHDGSTSYQIVAGVFRFVCCNGLVLGDTYGEVRVRHTGDAISEVIEGSYEVIDTAEKAMVSVDQLKAIDLQPAEREAFGEAALSIRYLDEKTGQVESPITVDQLLRPRRDADQGSSLWTTFNSVQENMLRGGLRGRRRDANNRIRRARTREIKGIDQNVKLNRALWTLTERMAELKGQPIAA